jgi:hypothetical protein
MSETLTKLERKVIRLCQISEDDYVRQRAVDREATKQRKTTKLDDMQESTDYLRRFARAIEQSRRPADARRDPVPSRSPRSRG